VEVVRRQVIGTCLFCRTFVHPRIGNVECFTVGFEVICDSCVEKLARAWIEHAGAGVSAGQAQVGADVQGTGGESTTPSAFVCPVCGKEFDNAGKLLAHRKKCKKTEEASE
jgi:hypothetical protein